MKWREILLGAFLSLIVTILGGIGVYYWTVPKGPPVERLVFVVAEPVRFDSATSGFCIQSVTIANEGNAPASDVEGAISFENEVKIQDHKASFSSGEGRSGSRITKEGDSKLHLRFPSLLPRESVKLSILVQKPYIKPPQVSIRSAITLGVDAATTSNYMQSKTVRNEKMVSLITGFALCVQLMLLFYLRPRFSEFNGLFQRSVNNLTFLYLHKGLVHEAGGILRSDIQKRGATGYELANYGLYLALIGATENAEKHFAAAEFYTPTESVRGLVALNRALMHIGRGDSEEALMHFQHAIKLSPKSIKKYSTYSDLIADACKIDSRIRDLFENLSKNH